MAETKIPSELEADLVAAYRSGMKPSVIQERLGVSRDLLYQVLRRHKVVPSRTREQREAESREAILVGLHELIRHQDRLIAEYEATIERLRKATNGSSRKRSAS